MNDKWITLTGSKFSIAGVLIATISATTIIIKAYVIDDKNAHIVKIENENRELLNEIRQLRDEIISLSSNSKQNKEVASQQANNNTDSIIIGTGAKVGEILKDGNDQERINYATKNIKSILEKECFKYKERLDWMFKEQTETYSAAWNFNPYALPKFSDTIKIQVSTNPHLIQSNDPFVTDMLATVGNIDYQHIFSLKSGDGRISKSIIRPYILNLHKVCDWVSV